MHRSQLLVITPLRKEFDVLVQALHHHGYAIEEAAVGKIQSCRFPTLGSTIAVGGHGKAQCAVQTQYLLDRCGEVSVVVCVGAAGCLAQRPQIGDLVVGTHTVEHDYNLRFVQRPLPMFPGDEAELESLRRSVSQSVWTFGISFGAIASGDEDIVTTDRAKALAAQTGAVCVAWEGAGVARACAFNEVPFMEIRGITDVADKAAPLDFSHNLQLALSHLALLLIAWCTGGQATTELHT